MRIAGSGISYRQNRVPGVSKDCSASGGEAPEIRLLRSGHRFQYMFDYDAGNMSHLVRYNEDGEMGMRMAKESLVLFRMPEFGEGGGLYV